MTRVLVTGVSGEVGSRLARRLATSTAITSIVGVDTKPLAAASPKMTFALLDVTSNDEFSLHLQKSDVVVFLVPPDASVDLAHFVKCCEQADVKHLVVASSTAVYGAWPDNDFPLLESSSLRPNPGFHLAAQFAERERIVHAAQGLEVTVLRMATLLGSTHKNQLAWDALTRVDWNTSRPMQFLHVDDAVEAFVLVIEQRILGTFNVAGEFVSAGKARELCGKSPETKLPTPLGRAVDRGLWSGRRYPHDFFATGNYLEHPWVVSSQHLESRGWSPRFTSAEALVASRVPRRWDRLRPGQRRALISNALFGAPVVVGAGAMAMITKRWINSRNR